MWGALGWWAGWLAMFLVRCWAVGVFLLSGSPVGWLLCVTEGLALWYGTWNVWVARGRDYSVGGLLVPALYLGGLALVPRDAGFGLVAFICGMVSTALSIVALFCLRSRFTFGGSSWVDLCDWGVYGVIRHPQQFARILLLAGLAADAVSYAHVGRLVVAGVCAFLVIVVEERALLDVPEYQAYKDRVRWAFIPGVA